MPLVEKLLILAIAAQVLLAFVLVFWLGSERVPRIRFPHPLALLVSCILLAAALTWILPAGKYERREDPVTGRSLVVPGTYAPTPATPDAGCPGGGSGPGNGTGCGVGNAYGQDNGKSKP